MFIIKQKMLSRLQRVLMNPNLLQSSYLTPGPQANPKQHKVALNLKVCERSGWLQAKLKQHKAFRQKYLKL